VNRRTQLWALGLVAAGVAAAGAVAITTSANADATGSASLNVQNIVFERLTGFQEDPAAIFSPATATFTAVIDDKNQQIKFKLTYKGFTSDVTQSHIHFGNRSQSGGVSAFLCSNLGNGPAGTAACPQGDATVTGTITAASVIGPTAQDINAGEFNKLVTAIRAGVTYANIHTVAHPGGEIRAQLDNRI
jgi:hypothetical protein